MIRAKMVLLSPYWRSLAHLVGNRVGLRLSGTVKSGLECYLRSISPFILSKLRQSPVIRVRLWLRYYSRGIELQCPSFCLAAIRRLDLASTLAK